MASQEQFLKALAKPYDRLLFAKDVLKPVFGSNFSLEQKLRPASEEPTKTEKQTIRSVGKYGQITLDDGRTVTCYEIELQPRVHIEQNRVTIQQYVRKLLPAGQSALINFVQSDDKTIWRFTLVAKQSVLTDEGIETKPTNAERYTYLVEANQPNRTLASRLEKLGAEKSQNLKALVEAFSVEKLSKLFFDEYKVQYDKFVSHLTGKIWTKSGVKEEGERISQFVNYFKTETDREKEARDFVKKLLGRIAFLYFVQKKGWLGTETPDFKKGNQDFIYDLFKQVPDDQKKRFYCDWLRPLFFDTLNRDDDHAFTMPDGSTVYIPFLNGGLFEEDKTDQNTGQLLLPGKLFSNPEDTESRNTRGFLDFLSAFNFTIHEDSPGDHTIAVDPEMLGHIFENLLEDNKDKGAYYTPKPIVHYMCQESLIEYLLTELTAENTEGAEKEELRGHLEDLIKKQEAGELAGFTEPILKSMKEVKVCDPAIGSGAFPMGILQEIYQAVETLHHLSPDKVKAIWELPDDDWHPAEVKKQIIQNSIYGVDIEKGAVDIARLRFWLSLIVDEEGPTALPNLDYKIVVGDSLVSKVILNGEDKVVELNWDITHDVPSLRPHVQNLKKALRSIVEKQKKFFEADNNEKNELREDIKQLKIDAIIHQLKYDREYYGIKVEHKGNAFPTSTEIKHNTERELNIAEFTKTIVDLKKVKHNPRMDFQHFEWRLDFPEILSEQVSKDTGFDVIIANPPYVKEYTNKAAFDGFRNSNYYQGKMDLWYGFACHSLDMLKESGVECFIAQNNWVTSSGASKMRNKVISDTRIVKLNDFGSFEIFENASIQTMIMLLQKKQVADDYKFELSKLTGSDHTLDDVVKLLSKEDIENASYIEAKINDTIRKGGYLVFGDQDSEQILEKIKSKGNFYLDKKEEIVQGIVPNPDVVNTRNIKKIPNSAVEEHNISVGDGVFVIPKAKKDLFEEEVTQYIKPLYHPHEVEKYSLSNSPSDFMIYLSKIEENQVPNSLLNHLSKYKEIMEARRENKKGSRDYFELHWPRDEIFFKKGPKILSVRKCSEPTFTFTEDETYVMMAFNIISSSRLNLKYATGVLNSKLIEYWLKNRGKMQGNNYQIDNEPLSEIPIYKPESDPGVEDLVDQILAQKEGSPDADTTDLEQQIDKLVYKLYNLTWEEVKVVDPEFGLSEEEYEIFEIE